MSWSSIRVASISISFIFVVIKCFLIIVFVWFSFEILKKCLLWWFWSWISILIIFIISLLCKTGCKSVIRFMTKLAIFFKWRFTFIIWVSINKVYMFCIFYIGWIYIICECINFKWKIICSFSFITNIFWINEFYESMENDRWF